MSILALNLEQDVSPCPHPSSSVRSLSFTKCHAWALSTLADFALDVNDVGNPGFSSFSLLHRETRRGGGGVFLAPCCSSQFFLWRIFEPGSEGEGVCVCVGKGEVATSKTTTGVYDVTLRSSVGRSVCSTCVVHLAVVVAFSHIEFLK